LIEANALPLSQTANRVTFMSNIVERAVGQQQHHHNHHHQQQQQQQQHFLLNDYTVSEKTVHFCFCQNFVKFP